MILPRPNYCPASGEAFTDMAKMQANKNGVIITFKKIQVSDNGVIRDLKKVQASDNGIIRTIFVMATGIPLGDLPVGAKVKDLNTIIYNNPIIFLIGGKNHAGYPANSVTLVTEKIIKLMGFDGAEATNPDANRKLLGSTRYLHSNQRQWLNKSGLNWYQAQHTYDAPPTTANMEGFNGYDTQPGFLTNLSAQMRNALLDTALTVAKATVDGGGSETVTDKVFLLSKAEVGLGAEGGINEGSLLPLFDTNDSSRVCLPTADAVINSEFTSASLNASSSWYYWLRSPTSSNSHQLRLVSTNGGQTNSSPRGGMYGLRPALNLPSSVLVSKTPDTDGAYIIQWQ